MFQKKRKEKSKIIEKINISLFIFKINLQEFVSNSYDITLIMFYLFIILNNIILVILITDIRVSYNAFMKEIAATAGSTTVFTPNPGAVS